MRNTTTVVIAAGAVLAGVLTGCEPEYDYSDHKGGFDPATGPRAHDRTPMSPEEADKLLQDLADWQERDPEAYQRAVEKVKQ